jgi:hypothetical protein
MRDTLVWRGNGSTGSRLHIHTCSLICVYAYSSIGSDQYIIMSRTRTDGTFRPRTS